MLLGKTHKKYICFLVVGQLVKPHKPLRKGVKNSTIMEAVEPPNAKKSPFSRKKN